MDVAKEDLELWARAALTTVPWVGGPAEIIYSGYRDRATARVMDFFQELFERYDDPTELDARLASSDRLDAAFGRAVRAAVESGLQEKRQALGRVVAGALEDDAFVDGAELLIATLASIEAPHVRAMTEIRHAVDQVKDAGEWPRRAAGAEHEIVSDVVSVGHRFDDLVIRSLSTLGLIYAGDMTDSWYVHDLTPRGYQLLEFLEADPGSQRQGEALPGQ